MTLDMYSDNLPEVLREMQPVYVRIHQNDVLMKFGVLGPLYLRVFREDVEPFGREMLAPGLWRD